MTTTALARRAATDMTRIRRGRAHETVSDQEHARLTRAWRAGKLPYSIKRQGDTYIAEIKLPLQSGRVLCCRGECSIREAASEMGYDYDSLVDLSYWDDDDWDAVISAPEWGHTFTGEDELMEGVFDDIWKGTKKVGKSVGKGFKAVGKTLKKTAKSKAFKKAVKITGKVVTHPATMAALGAVTGGAALPTLAAAKAAYDIYDMAKGTGKAAKSAKKLAKAALHVADRQSGRKPKPKRRTIKRGYYKGTRLRPDQVAKLERLRGQVAIAAKKRRAKRAKAAVRARKKTRAKRVLPRPSGRATFKYLVAIQDQAA